MNNEKYSHPSKIFLTMEYCASQTKWKDYCNNSINSNLLQAWIYGEAKAKSDGWRVGRGVIKMGSQPIAVCQWLQKSISRLLCVTRINRGPIWLVEKPDDEIQKKVFHFLMKHFHCAIFSVLSVAPDLFDNVENRNILKELKFRRRKKQHGWQSALVDLKKTEEELRLSLRGRLRNYIKQADIKNYAFNIHTSAEDFKNILMKYNCMQQEKKFTGISAKLLALLCDISGEGGDVFVARLKDQGGEILAEKFLVIYGNQCIPLIAWTSELGVKLHAMHFLVWKILLYLKHRGILYYDVGGYSEREHQSVCQFKKGFRGEEYCLVGEYYKIL